MHTFLAYNLQTPDPLRGELLAILLALQLVPKGSTLTINTDSQQAINKITAFIHNNYKKKKKINNHRATLNTITELIIKKDINIKSKKSQLLKILNIVDTLFKEAIFIPNKVLPINYKAMITKIFLFERNHSLINKSVKGITKTFHDISTVNNLFGQFRIASTLNKSMVKSINWHKMT